MKEIIVITGCSGRIGTRLVDHFLKDNRYQVVGFDTRVKKSENGATFFEVDIASDENVQSAFQKVKEKFGNRIASVIHLAAYYSFSKGEPEKYQQITVNGTERILSALQDFEVEQFIFSSTQIVHAPVAIGEVINEDSPIEPSFDYPESKTKTESLIHQKRGKIPSLILRICGCYDADCFSIPISQHIDRIYKKQLVARFFPGNIHAGAPFIHFDDLTRAFDIAVKEREALGKEHPDCTLLLGEDTTMGFDAIQRKISKRIHGKEWGTIRIPKWFAKMGAWLQNNIPFVKKPFIQPWMIGIADNHYQLDISKANEILGWKPKHSVDTCIDEMLDRLLENPRKFYQNNQLDITKTLEKKWQKDGK